MSYMANGGKGRLVEIYNRIEANDPANSALILVPLSKAGTEAQGQDIDTLKALLEDANFTEQTEGEWARQVLTDAELAAAPGPDDEANTNGVQNPEVSFGEPTAGKVPALALCYDADTTSGDDGDLEFLGLVTFQNAKEEATEIVADGNEVVFKEGALFDAS